MDSLDSRSLLDAHTLDEKLNYMYYSRAIFLHFRKLHIVSCAGLEKLPHQELKRQNFGHRFLQILRPIPHPNKVSSFLGDLVLFSSSVYLFFASSLLGVCFFPWLFFHQSDPEHRCRMLWPASFHSHLYCLTLPCHHLK